MSKVASRSWRVLPLLIVAFAAYYLLTAPRVAALQTTTTCPSYSNVTVSSCTQFGYGDDWTIRNTARNLLGQSQYNVNEFCTRVMQNADGWLAFWMQGAAGTIIQNSDQSTRAALSAFTPHNRSWTAGWLNAGWFRNTSWTIAYRAQVLRNVALHEAGHKVCEEGDTGVSCDGEDDEQTQAAVDACFAVN